MAHFYAFHNSRKAIPLSIMIYKNIIYVLIIDVLNLNSVQVYATKLKNVRVIFFSNKNGHVPGIILQRKMVQSIAPFQPKRTIGWSIHNWISKRHDGSSPVDHNSYLYYMERCFNLVYSGLANRKTEKTSQMFHGILYLISEFSDVLINEPVKWWPCIFRGRNFIVT